jgi:hypothetical protein
MVIQFRKSIDDLLMGASKITLIGGAQPMRTFSIDYTGKNLTMPIILIAFSLPLCIIATTLKISIKRPLHNVISRSISDEKSLSRLKGGIFKISPGVYLERHRRFLASLGMT